MSSVYGLVADVHLHAWSSFSQVLPSGLNSRLAGLLSELRRCSVETVRAGGKKVVIAGDVFHVRGSVAPSVLNPTIDTLRQIHEELGVTFTIIAGNHDLEGKIATRLGSAITALESPWVRVCDQVHVDAEIKAMMVPWIESTGALKEEIVALTKLDAYDHADFDLILHAPIDGVIPGLPSHGLEPEWLSSLGFKRVTSGHYHNHKQFDGGVISIGALAHHTWSDVGTRAGFLMVHPDRVNWMKSHLPEFVDLTRLVDLEPDEIPLMVDKNYVRVRVEASKVKDVEAARAELIKMGAAGVLVQTQPKPAAETAREGAPSVKSGASLEVSVGEFVKSMKDVDHAAVAAEAMAVLGSLKETA